MHYKAEDRETITYIKSIAAATSLPIMIYNAPYDYKIEVTLAMFEEPSTIPSIQAIKESTREVSNVTGMYNSFGNRFEILSGVFTLALEELALGRRLGRRLPAETVAIYQLMKAGRYKEALAIYRWFLPVLELDIYAKLVQYIKLAATQTGISSQYVRAPRLMLQGEERIRVLKVINDAIATRPPLKDYFNLFKNLVVEIA